MRLPPEGRRLLCCQRGIFSRLSLKIPGRGHLDGKALGGLEGGGVRGTDSPAGTTFGCPLMPEVTLFGFRSPHEERA